MRDRQGLYLKVPAMLSGSCATEYVDCGGGVRYQV